MEAFAGASCERCSLDTEAPVNKRVPSHLFQFLMLMLPAFRLQPSQSNIDCFHLKGTVCVACLIFFRCQGVEIIGLTECFIGKRESLAKAQWLMLINLASTAIRAHSLSSLCNVFASAAVQSSGRS